MDLAFKIPEKSIVDRGDYLVVNTPTIPDYYYGNFIIFGQPPGSGDLDRWRSVFADEFGDQPGVEHELFGWDSSTGDMGAAQAFVDAGFTQERDSVMIADELTRPGRCSDEIAIQAVESDAQWDEAARCYASHGERVTLPNSRVLANIAHWRSLAERTDAVRYSATLDGELVAGMGVYRMLEDGVVDNVVTYPEFRRRGIGRTMVYEACVDAMERLGVRRMVLAADEGGAAERMYERIGFRTVEKQVGLSRT